MSCRDNSYSTLQGLGSSPMALSNAALSPIATPGTQAMNSAGIRPVASRGRWMRMGTLWFLGLRSGLQNAVVALTQSPLQRLASGANGKFVPVDQPQMNQLLLLR